MLCAFSKIKAAQINNTQGIISANKNLDLKTETLKFDLQFFANKPDIKQIKDIAKKFKMTPEQRRDFGDYVESFKTGIPNNKNFSFSKLEEMAKEFLGVK